MPKRDPAPHRDTAKRPSDVGLLGDEQALAWFAKLNGPDVTDCQRMAFNRWLGLDPGNRRSFQAVLTLWQRLGPTEQPPSI